MDPVALVAQLVEKHACAHPVFVRNLLALAYKTVTLRGAFANVHTYRGATDRFNGEIAKTITASFLHPQRAAMVNVFMPCEVLYAANVTAMFPEGISVYVACTQSSLPFVQAAEEAGVPESFCSYHKLMLGMDAHGVLPKTALIANTTLACDANQLSFRFLSKKTDGSLVPRVVIEVPYIDTSSKTAIQGLEGEEPHNTAREIQEEMPEGREHRMSDDSSEEAIQDVAKQLWVMTREMEKTLGVSVKQDALVTACKRSYQTLCNMRDYLKLRPAIALPTTLTGELCMLIATHIMAGTEAALDFSNNLLCIAKREAKKNSLQTSETPRRPQKPRIFWMHTLPNWQQAVMDLFETAESTAAARAEIVGNDMAYDFLYALENLNPQDPYDYMARRLVMSSSNGPATRRIACALSAAKESGANGAILFAHWGCRQTAGMAHLAKEAFEREGIPLLVLDGDGCDPRNAPDGQMATRLEAFIEQLS